MLINEGFQLFQMEKNAPGSAVDALTDLSVRRTEEQQNFISPVRSQALKSHSRVGISLDPQPELQLISADPSQIKPEKNKL